MYAKPLTISWVLFISALLIVGSAISQTAPANSVPDKISSAPKRPVIKKKGTLGLDLCESTPFVFHGKLYRLEWFRNGGYQRIMDHDTHKEVSHFGDKHRFASAYVEGNTVYVVGTKETAGWCGNVLTMFTSTDLKNWTQRTAFTIKDYNICNTSICKTNDRYVMSIEMTKPSGFPARFIESKDLLNWKLMPPQHTHHLGRYNAAHCLRWHDGWFYLFYLEAGKPHGYEQYITRSRDLINWESSPLNPVLAASSEDKLILNPLLTEFERAEIVKNGDTNNSDIDFCEYKGKLIINYSWGTQGEGGGHEHLAEAEYDGTVAQFLTGWFPKSLDSNRISNHVPIPPGSSKEEIIRLAANVKPTGRQLKWQEMELIAFIHFPGNFVDVDTDQWVQVCKDAGMKMVVLTTKQHGGFCLWPSKYTDSSVKNSAWKNGKGDVVGELAKSCRDAGLKLGVYLSPYDMHEPTHGTEKYSDFFKNQLTELLSNYGDIAEVWFDGAYTTDHPYDWPGFYRLVRKLQPNAVIAICGPDVRWVGNESGLGRETEWSVVPDKARDWGKSAENFSDFNLMDKDLGSREKIYKAQSLTWYPAEVDVSLRPGWNYSKSEDDKVKTFGPMPSGPIHKKDAARIRQFRKVLDATFDENLALSAKAKASTVRGNKSMFGAGNITDGDKNTYWMTDDSVTASVIEFDLGEKKTFNRVMLQEYIQIGQRVEEFAVEAWDGNNWKEFARGTTIGYKRLLRFDDITAQKVRLRINRSRVCPTISNFGLFYAPPIDKILSN